ncbi:hypothetical protein [Thermomonospora cellulosilytica]|uniref:Band 7 domain-containing protein n=1 Tax=Thermomonospora cellulosilytica TaxID=1411118 RepID=A0A7W3MW93_9ACTN|nr:hypothetical protein [Thermomonospora cellulosilytica]MBA9002989.1 hypothetical protein [Thermomonospora cellulosilytica]
MPKPYPIIESRILPPVGRSGLFGLGDRKRDWADLPPIKADQAQVYLVDGRHVVDRGRLGPGDDIVVRATHVSVVDLTTNRGVSVELTIPSADAKQFTVRANFLCTVLEPDKIVKCGQGDAATVLLDYLRGYQRLFQLGLDYKISAVNEVRLLVQSQLESYHKHVPPQAPGMRAVLASTEVLTPDELVAFHDSRFKNEQRYLTESAQAQYEMELQRLKAAHAEQLELQKKSYELKLAEQQYNLDMARQLGRQQMTASENRFAADQARRLRSEIGDDPTTAAYFALQRNEGSAEQIAADLQQAQAEVEARRRELQDREFELRMAERKRQWAREDREFELEKAERDRRRALEDRAADWEREDRLRVFASRLDVMKELAKHGHLDEVSIDELDRLMDRLVGQATSKTELGAPAEPKGELAEAEGDEPFSEEED